jgi:hypothetical protein
LVESCDIIERTPLPPVQVEMLRAKLAEAEGAKIEIDTSRRVDLVFRTVSITLWLFNIAMENCPFNYPLVI